MSPLPNSVSETDTVSIIECKKRMVPTPLGPSKRGRVNSWATKQGQTSECILLTLKLYSNVILSAQNSLQCPMT
jgi:hypothetical protein